MWSRPSRRSAIADVRETSDLSLALFYVPRPHRFLVTSLFDLDAAMGEVVRTTSEPMVGQIRLAWWRERLEELDRGIVPAEPHLQAAADIVVQGKVTGAELGALADRWVALLEPFPWDEDVAEAISERGRGLFGMGARIAGAAEAEAQAAGGVWALVDVARHCTDPQSREQLVTAARNLASSLEGVAEEKARPLTMLGLLARRDLDRWPEVEQEATPARAWLMIRHRLTGRL